MSRARDLADSADKDIAGTLNLDGLDVAGNITVTGTVDGRDVATDGTKLDGVEAGADVTDVTNVTAAGALMDSEVTNLTQVKAFDSSDYATAAQGATADAALPKSGGTMTGSVTFAAGQTFDGRDLSVDGSKLDGIESGATADQTKADIDALNINADTLDGQHGSYYTTYADTAVSNLVDSAPTTLDTLNELAAALGDDANFSTTVTNSIATKMPLAGGTFTGDVTFSGGQSAITLTSGSDIRATTGSWTGEHSGKLQYHDSDWYIQFADKMIGRNGSGVNVFEVNSSGDGYFTNSLQIAGGTAWHSGNDGSGSGLDADTLDGVQGSNFLRSDQYDEATGDIVFSGGAGAVTIGASSDIRASGGGGWTGEAAGKMQYYSNNWYLQYATNFFVRDGNGNNRLTVDGSGNVTAHGNVTAFSDIKLKKDIVTIENALDKINAMRGVYYTEIETDRARTGVIAQEVEKVLPEVVLEIEDYNPETGETDTTKAVDYGNMVGLLIEAIKELKSEIEELKNGSTK